MKKKYTNLAEEIKRREDYNLLCPFPYYCREQIKDLKAKQMTIGRKADYNNVPVSYCKTCLSIALKVITFEGQKDLSTGKEREVTYCIPCGNTDIESTHVTEWEDFYLSKYGKKFIDE